MSSFSDASTSMQSVLNLNETKSTWLSHVHSVRICVKGFSFFSPYFRFVKLVSVNTCVSRIFSFSYAVSRRFVFLAISASLGFSNVQQTRSYYVFFETWNKCRTGGCVVANCCQFRIDATCSMPLVVRVRTFAEEATSQAMRCPMCQQSREKGGYVRQCQGTSVKRFVSFFFMEC